MTQTVRHYNACQVPFQYHDGDTVRLMIDVGFEAAAFPWLRLRRVYAPEEGQPGHSECLVALVAWFGAQQRLAAAGDRWALEVDTFRTAGGNEVRTLAWYVAEVRGVNGDSLNDHMINLIAAHPEWPRGTGG